MRSFTSRIRTVACAQGSMSYDRISREGAL